MRRIAALLGGLLLSVAAIAAVTVTESQRVTLLRGTSLQSTALCPQGTCPSTAVCKAEARRLAEGSTATSGTVSYFCQNERDVITAVYRPNPPPPPVDCLVSDPAVTTGQWTACTNGARSRTDTLTRTIITPPANGGAACPPLVTTITVTEPCVVTPPPSNAIVADDFNYVVDRLGSKAAFTAPGRWQGIKDQATRAGANGYLYTADFMPNCGRAPDGSRFLVMEGLPTTLGAQTDYYLQTRFGPNGTIPAHFRVALQICVESGDIDGQHNKFLYPLFGTRDAWPMSALEQPVLVVQTDHVYRGSTALQAPQPGCFVFTNLTTGTKARVESQVASGNGSKLTPNIDGVNPWICPSDGWVEAELEFDVSGPQGRYTTKIRRAGETDWTTITDWQGGVTPGFTWPTTALDREGAKGLRTPTTQGPGSGTPGPDRTMLLNSLTISALPPAGIN